MLTPNMLSTAHDYSIQRRFTAEDQEVFDSVEWELRDAKIKGENVVFEQKGVEFPKSWSQNATNIVSDKYLRVRPGEGKETSVRQMIDRVISWYTRVASKQKYFNTFYERDSFKEELKHLLLHQKMAFNSPVWFNVGIKERPRVSACFILDVKDDMQSILNWYVEEGLVFKQGSGAGTNLSRIRSSGESLSLGGKASGPVSFMRGADASAGAIKSGGSTRRSAKLIALNVDHPDIEEFIQCKVHEEKKARVLRAAGFDMNLGGKDSYSLQYQNANNSVGLTDKFLNAYVNDENWDLVSVTEPKTVMKTVKARDLMHQIAEAAWDCADPGVFYLDTMNGWHTSPAMGYIDATNPCQPGFATVVTPDGVRTFDDIDVGSTIWSGEKWTKVVSKVATGTKPVFRYKTNGKGEFVGTENHRVVSRGVKKEVKDVDSIDLCPKPGELLIDNMPAKITEVEALGEMPVFDITVDDEAHTYWSGGLLVSNCGEFVRPPNTSCNLASLRLTKFYNPETREFHVEDFMHAVDVTITAMDASVSAADYPTQAIEDTVNQYRELGIGVTDLGALLMQMGIPYGSDEGRAVAAVVTALLTGAAYRRSAILAEKVGPYPGWHVNTALHSNSTAHLAVINKHMDALDNIDEKLLEKHNLEHLLFYARSAWEDAKRLGVTFGFRNAQVSLQAPTGSISFLMDADTTGIEPDLALVKIKKMVDGGSMKIVNQSVPIALKALGYRAGEVNDICEFVYANNSVKNSPHLKQEHYKVFQCALGDDSIHYLDHIKMLAAIQPFISGSSSKTINMPENTTVEEIKSAYILGWKLGLKNLAIYRDNCKVNQPLNAEKKDKKESKEVKPAPATRKKLPKQRRGTTTSFNIDGCNGYIRTGEFQDGSLGEIFLDVSKQGSTLSGIMDAFAISVSLGLQHGVPLREYVSKFLNQNFTPNGITSDPDFTYAKSLVDYIFKRLAVDYLDKEERDRLHIKTKSEKIAELDSKETAKESKPVVEKEVRKAQDTPLCVNCGVGMRSAGSCFVCEECGLTSGCS